MIATMKRERSNHLYSFFLLLGLIPLHTRATSCPAALKINPFAKDYAFRVGNLFSWG